MPTPNFAVFRTRGPAWDHDKPMRSQDNWNAHARFMDNLTAENFIIMGGPLTGSPDVLLIISAKNEQQIRNTLSLDPWETAGLLTTQQIHPWTVLLDSGQSFSIPET